MHRSTTAQLRDAAHELVVWLAPVAILFVVVSTLAVGFGLVIPPITSADIALGLLLATAISAGYAHHRARVLTQE